MLAIVIFVCLIDSFTKKMLLLQCPNSPSAMCPVPHGLLIHKAPEPFIAKSSEEDSQVVRREELTTLHNPDYLQSTFAEPHLLTNGIESHNKRSGSSK